jgi:2-desacetyl-2-hydroxyethyl bacteriochlorophyllide A dehydrogenase
MSRGRAIVFAARDRIELVEISVPALRADEVLIETEITAISQGTDRAMVAGTYAGVETRYPFIYGYSRVGRVLEAGGDVSGVRVGDRVFVGMAGTRLDRGDGLGEVGGAYTSHAVVHHTEVVVLPDSVSSTTAAICALGAIAYQGVVASDVRPRSRVLVAGLGAIGQFGALIARLHGAQVWAVDPVPERRALAGRIAGAETLAPGEDLAVRIEETAWGARPWRGRNEEPTSRYERMRWAQPAGVVDVVIDATGRNDALEAYLPLVAREGCICLQGYYAQPLTLDFHAAHMKRVMIRCPGGMDLVDYESVLRLVVGTEVASLVGLEVDVEQAPVVMRDLLLRPSSDVVSAVVRWSEA